MKPALLLLTAATSAVLPLRAQERPSDTLLTVNRYLDYESGATRASLPTAARSSGAGGTSTR